MSPTIRPGDLEAITRRRSATRRRRVTVRAMALAGIAALIVAACGGGAGDGGGGSSAGGQKTLDLTVGVQTKILQTYYPQLAEKLGFFRQEGLNVKVIEGQSPASSIQALIGGSLDLYLGGPEALPAAVRGSDIKFIAAASNRSIWDIVATKDIRSVQDLKGKLFGVSATTSISTAAAKQALQTQGVDPESVKYVVAGGTGNRYTALTSGRIQAAPLGIPVNYQAADSGKLNDLGGTDTDLGAPPIAAVVLTVSKRWADGNKEALQRFLRAYQRVIDALYDPAMTEKIVSAASADIKVDPKYMRRAVQTLFLDAKTGGTVLPRDGHIDLKAMQNAADAFVGLKVLPSKVDVRKYVDMSYLEAAQASLKKG
jgi:NitT/TauT family transport system substrate-binding protein